MTALGPDLGRDFAQLRPECRQRLRRQRARRVDDDGDRLDPLGADRGEIEPRVDKAPVGQAPGIVALRRVGHVAPQQRPPVERAGMGALHGFLDLARHLAFGAGDVERLVHCLVPGLLLGGDVHRRLRRTHRRPRQPRAPASMTSPVPDGSWLGGALDEPFSLWPLPSRLWPSPSPSPSCEVATAAVLVLGVRRRIGGIGRGRRCHRHRRPARFGRRPTRRHRRRRSDASAVVPGIAVFGRRQAAVGLLDAQVVPRFRSRAAA